MKSTTSFEPRRRSLVATRHARPRSRVRVIVRGFVAAATVLAALLHAGCLDLTPTPRRDAGPDDAAASDDASDAASDGATDAASD